MPFYKFLCVKTVIFFTWWQSIFLYCLVSLGHIDSSHDHSTKEVGALIHDLLVCIEMSVAAMAFLHSFSTWDFQPKARGGQNGSVSMKQHTSFFAVPLNPIESLQQSAVFLSDEDQDADAEGKTMAEVNSLSLQAIIEAVIKDFRLSPTLQGIKASKIESPTRNLFSVLHNTAKERGLLINNYPTLPPSSFPETNNSTGSCANNVAATGFSLGDQSTIPFSEALWCVIIQRELLDDLKDVSHHVRRALYNYVSHLF